MAITTRQKTVFATSDGKEHATRLEATRYETRLTLAQLGFKMETATQITGMSAATLRGIAACLNDYSDALVEIKREEATRTREEVNDLGEDSVGAWPADANVAPRPGDRLVPRRPANVVEVDYTCPGCGAQMHEQHHDQCSHYGEGPKT